MSAILDSTAGETEPSARSRSLELARQYNAARPRLTRIAYAVLGSTSDAEDVVSEGWLRLVTADAKEPVHDVSAWATVAVGRLALTVLGSARVRREQYVGPWLPEPLVSMANDPADQVAQDESISFAVMVMLEALTPAERTAFVLHDLFQINFPAVAGIVGKSPDAVRQLASRARQHLASGDARQPVSAGEHDSTVRAFLRAASTGDIGSLVEILDPNVMLTSDGGGMVSAARRPVFGPDRVSRFVLGVAGKMRSGQRLETVTVNGRTGLALFDEDRIVNVVALTVLGNLITRIDLVVAPDKLPRSAGTDPSAGSGDATDLRAKLDP